MTFVAGKFGTQSTQRPDPDSYRDHRDTKNTKLPVHRFDLYELAVNLNINK